MSTIPIRPSHLPIITPAQLGMLGTTTKHGGTPVHQSLLQNILPKVGIGLGKDLKNLLDLKNKLMGTHKGKGRLHNPKARREHLQGRMDQITQKLMNRLGRMMNRFQNRGCPKSQTTDPSGAAKSGSDYAFLDDPNMSMSDKIELFLQKIIKDSEEKMEKLMQDYDAKGTSTDKSTGKSTGKSKKKAKGKKWAKVGSIFLKIGTAVAAVVASVYGTPAAGAAVMAGGAALSKAVDNAVDKKYGDSTTGSTTGNSTDVTAEDKAKTEGDRRMIFFKIQKLQTAVQEMITFFSTKLKKEADLNSTLIRNMA